MTNNSIAEFSKSYQNRLIRRSIPCALMTVLFLFMLVQASHSASPDSYQVTVTVDPTFKKNDISHLIYGNNTKWLFNGESNFNLDNGIWSRDGNSINPNTLSFIKDSGISILRYGDGANADFFYWGWSILPFRNRLKDKVVNRWGSKENYVFGILEFIKLCRIIKCEANIIINYRMSLLDIFYDREKYQDNRQKLEIATQQAENLVEFLNSPIITTTQNSYPLEYLPEYSLQKMPKGYFAYLRVQMGFIEPIGVKYWEIGNETNTQHDPGKQAREVGLKMLDPVPVSEYTLNAIRFSKQMKSVDPDINIGIVEYPKYLRNQLSLLSKEPRTLDFLIAHDYIKGSFGGHTGAYVFYGSKWGGGLSRDVYVEQGGEYTLDISAWGRAYLGDKYPTEKGVVPKLSIKINGESAGALNINKNIDIANKRVLKKFKNYNLPVVLQPGKNKIQMRLGNDFMDKDSQDIDRRGRDIFVGSIRLLNPTMDKELLWEDPIFPIYSQLPVIQKKMKNRSALVKTYAPHMFVAQTESAVHPNSADLGAALVEAGMLFAAMDNQIKIRNFWHLFGTCDRMGSIHSGTREKSNYHVTPQYLVLKLFSRNFGDMLIKSVVDTPTFSVKPPARSDRDKEQAEILLPYLAARASKSGKRVYVGFVNFEANRVANIKLDFWGFEPASCVLHVIASKKNGDILATNEVDPENVIITSIKIQPPLTEFELPPGSVAIAEYF